MKKLLLRGFIVLVSFIAVVFAYNNSEKKIPTQYELLVKKAKKHQDLTYDEIKKLPKRDRPDLAALQDFEMTMDPSLGYPPVERKLQAYGIAKSILAKSSNQAKIAGVEWQERGPNNVGGRTRALMFDPNDADVKKVWAGGIGGGLWYNDDITSEQSVWRAVDDFMANIAISCIAYDPSNTQNYYFGTGLGFTSRLSGAGIWKSTDAGATWVRLSSTEVSDFEYVQKIEVTKNGTILAGTNSGLMRSTDGGDNWTNVLDNGISDIEIASNEFIYASRGHLGNESGAIFKSEDDGETWTDVSPDGAASRIEIGVAPSNSDVLYAVADGGSGSTDVAWFQKSIDGGTTWENVEIPFYKEQDCSVGTQHFTRGQAFFDLIIGVHPLNENIVIVGGIDLHKSTNGGQSWEGISYWTGGNCDDLVHADQHALEYRPGHPNEAVFGNDGGVYYSGDVGSASNPEFVARNNGYNVTTFYAAATANVVNSNVFLAGAQDNGTQLFNQPGMNSTSEATGGDGGYCFIDQDNADIMISSFVYNSYRLSTDGGKSFANISDDQDRGRFINPSEYDSDADVLYGAGDVGEITRISNISTTATELEIIDIAVEDRQITHIKASPYTDNLLFIGVRISDGEGLLFKIEDADTDTPTVTEITGTYSGSHGGWISSIDVGASDDQLLATFSNYGVNSVYETTDGGANWTDKNGDLPDMPVRWGLYNPNDRKEVLLATEVGVWSTDDLSQASPVWEPTNAGLANVRTDMIKYREADQMVVIATFGRGLYTSDVFSTVADADFSTRQTVAYVGVPVRFTDASLNSNDLWSWDFGDGVGSSPDQNPSYTYTTAGIYSVKLTIDGGASDITKIDYVTVLPVKPMPYTLADGGDFESNLTDFTARTISGGVSHWEVGAPTNRLATVSSGTNVWKTKLDADIEDLGYDYKSGLYTPGFDLSDDTKEYTLKFKKSMENSFCNAPHAMQLQYSTDGGINWYRLGGSFPEFGAVNWYNMASNLSCSITSSIFEDKTGWVGTNIDDGTDNSVDDENTEHKLNFLAGQANVSFRFVSAVSAGSGEGAYDRDGFMIDDFEIEMKDPTADFEVDKRLVFIDQAVNFKYASNGATSLEWSFGDDGTSTDENPSHTYTSSGIYTVKLTIQGSGGEVSETKTDYITVLANKTVPYTLADGGDFESNLIDFGAVNVSGTPFELGSSSISGKDGTASGENAWVTGIDDAEYVDDSEAYLYTPSFDFSNIGNYTIKFKANYKFESNWDGFIVEYSVDRGSTWIKLNEDDEEGNWYNQRSDPQSVFGVEVPIISGDTNGNFDEFFTDVSSLAPNESVIFRFKFLSDAATVDVGMALDDFELDGPTPGPAVPDFVADVASGCEGRTAIFSNATTGSISSLSWDFGVGASPATAEGLGPHEVVYSTAGSSTVSLTVESPVNGTQNETKTDYITTGAIHLPTVTQEEGSDAGTFRLQASEGDAYQWYFEGAIIDGETSQTHETSLRGNYSVGVTIGGCTVITDNIAVVSSTKDFLEESPATRLYPNPVKEKLTIVLENEYYGAISVLIYDLQGKVQNTQIEFRKSSKKQEFVLNVNQLDAGMYFVEVIYGDNRLTRQVVIGK